MSKSYQKNIVFKKTVFFTKYKMATIIGALFLSFILGVYVKSINSPKIAIVNVKQIVAHSKKLDAIRQENNKKIEELSKWIDGAKEEIRKEKNRTKKEDLTRQYMDIATQRKDLLKYEYNTKLQEMEEEITNLIKSVAHKVGYNIIFDQAVVIDGGKNITAKVIEELNKNIKE